MLQLYDKNKNKIKGLTKYKDYCIESVLKTGDKTLSFLYPSKFIDGIVEEGYIRNKADEFVIKEMADRGDWTSIKAQMNVEDLEGKAWEHFNTTEQTIENCLNLACAGTGWTVQVNNVSKKRTVKKTNCSSWDLIQEAKKIYRVEIEFDTLNKIIYVKEKQGQDKGVYFSDEINLKALDIESNSYDFYTKIIAIGKENIKVEVENFQYSNKVKTLIWKDERYTVLENLREDATAKLQELSKPRKSYSADVIDLANLNPKYKNILNYKLGDTITLISKDKKIREKQRIVKIVEYPDEPERNSCEIANTTLDFIDIQKEFQDTADTVNNITEDNGTISEEAIKVAVKNLTIDKADINSLNAAVARIGTLEATKANITELNAVNAKITNLQANKAEITDLIAGNIKFDVATGGTLDLQTLLSKFVTGENGQFLNLTTDNVTISNALIKDVIAKSISVEDLKASTISTNKFRITSDNGGIEIVGATQQFKDKNNKVRIQMGQDTQGNFNFILRGEDGTTTLIDHTGIKEKAIADKLIKSNMVADNAIGEQQINYSSLVTGLNKDTNTSLIQASKVAIDLTGQSLDVAFNSLESSVKGFDDRIKANTTSISVAQGKIEGLIKESSITKGDVTTLKDNYTSIAATVDGINTTVSSHTSNIGSLNTNVSTIQSSITQLNNQIALKVEQTDIDTAVSAVDKKITATNAKVSSIDVNLNGITQRVTSTEGDITSLTNRMTTVEQDLSGYKITVNNTYLNKTDAVNIYATKSSMELTATQLKLDFSSSGGYNFVKNGNFQNGKAFWDKVGEPSIFAVGKYRPNGYGENVLALTTTASGQQSSQLIEGLQVGRKYTVSCYIYIGRGSICMMEGNQWNGVYTKGTGWQWISFSFVPNDSSVVIFIGSNDTAPIGSCHITAVSVTEGSERLAWTPHPNEIYSGNTVIDANGVTIYNGALTVKNNAGQIMLQADSVGDLTFKGKLQPNDYQVKLFGNDCKIDGSAGAIRMQWNPQNYISVENGATRIYDNNSAGGTRYISFATDTEGHANIWGTQTRMKLLGNSSARPVIQSRNISDNAYGDFHGADFLNRSTIKDKTNIQEINDIDFKKLLMENTIRKYNLKTDVETVLDGFGLENTIDEVVASSADIRLGFILEELTQDARAMLSPGNMESISIYSMCSILWKVCQEQQKRIEALENLQ